MSPHTDAATRARAAWLADGRMDDDSDLGWLREAYIAGFVAGSAPCQRPCCVGESLAQPMPTREVPNYVSDNTRDDPSLWTTSQAGIE